MRRTAGAYLRPWLQLAAAGAAVPGCAEGPPAPVEIGAPAPEYAAMDMRGDTVALSDFRGRALLVNVWATWCLPCRTEMPALQAMRTELVDEGLEVVGVSIDGEGARGLVEAFLDEVGVEFPVLHDPRERVVRTFRTVGVPESFLIDRRGELVHRWRGPFDPGSTENRARIAAALQRPP